MSTDATTDYWNTSEVIVWRGNNNLARPSSGLPVVNLVLYLAIGCVGLVGNAFVILVIFTHTAMKKQMTNLLIINQSLIDAVTSVVLIFSVIFTTSRRPMPGVSGILLCRLWYSAFPLFATLTSSTYNLLAIALERYFCIVYPIMYKNRVTARYIIVVCFIAWAIGPAVMWLYTISHRTIDRNKFCTRVWSSQNVKAGLGLFNYAINLLIPLLVMLFCYLKIVLILKSRGATVTIQPATRSESGQGKRDNMAKATRNVFKTLITVTVCFMVCWIPNRTLYMSMNVGRSWKVPSWAYHLFVLLGYFNCCINPFVYAAQYEQFQKGVRKLKTAIGSRISSTATSTSVTTVSDTHTINK